MIINSLLDTDLYKFTMGQVALHQFPWVNVKYEFKCRNHSDWTLEQIRRLRNELESFTELRFTKEELDYLSGLRFIKPSYIDFLKLYSPDISHLNVSFEDGQLSISVEGPWFLTVYWEVPVLAIVNEVYFSGSLEGKVSDGLSRLDDKLLLNQRVPFNFADFGTRRTYRS